jgi:hypothetical protein
MTTNVPSEPAPEQLPAVPVGVGSMATLTGFLGAIVAFITSWAQYGMTPETVTLGATAGAILAAFFIGRSVQASSLYKKVEPVVTTVRTTVAEELAKKETPTT